MPRDIPVGNGQFLVNFDRHYQIRDVYYPHVGQENHGGGQPCRFGIYADMPINSAWADEHGQIHTRTEPGERRLFWSHEGFATSLKYVRDTLLTNVTLEHRALQLTLQCHDAVDFHRPILVRKIRVTNNAHHRRSITVFLHQDFNMYGNKIGDTAYFDPELRAVIHYRGQRYLMATFFSDHTQGLGEYACGTSGFNGAEGTWRDAEDGRLGGNSIAQGAVDSTISTTVELDPGEEKHVYYVLAAGKTRADLLEQQAFLSKNSPQNILDRTAAYWRLWVGAMNVNFGNLPPKIADLCKRSLLVLRTQINNNGAIIAANDSDFLQFNRDTYSYVWPRDGALVAHALDLAGFSDIARSFYSFCKDTITPEGYLLHKYNPDGSPASSWHPWVYKGKQQLPIQEDETALVIWALWRHFFRYRDIEFVRPLYLHLITKAADFMVKYRDKHTGLPGGSYDLWEERWGIHSFTVAAVYGGLKAAANFAICFGDRERAKEYSQAAAEIQEAFVKHMWSEKLGRFVRRITPFENGGYNVDETLDASLYGIYKFHLLPAYDPRVIATMRAVEERLWCKTSVGGVARYENDYYHRVADDIGNVPGNPWFICTLWLADYKISRASTVEELKESLPILEWVAQRAAESGVLAEQVNPYTNEPLSVSPLTWSHATLVNTVIKYLEKLETMKSCGVCGQSIYHMRRQRNEMHVTNAGVVDEYDAALGDEHHHPQNLAAEASFIKEVEGGEARRISLAIDQTNCIGCGICVMSCPSDILKSHSNKAFIKLPVLSNCTACGNCQELCPVSVFTMRDGRATEECTHDHAPLPTYQPDGRGHLLTSDQPIAITTSS